MDIQPDDTISFAVNGYDYDTTRKAVDTKCGSNGPHSGLYRLRLRNASGDGLAVIPRLVKPDQEGVLYIGTSQNVVSRVDMLMHAIKRAYNPAHRTSKEHICARAIGEAFISTFPIDRLEVQIIPLASQNRFDWFVNEWRMLTAYYHEHGEWPPMNGLKPSRET